jgi:hypothetical protein
VLWRTAEEAHRFVWEDGDVALSLGGVLFDLMKHARGGRHPTEPGADSAPRDRYRRAAAGLFDAGVVLSEVLADGAVVLTAPPIGDGGMWIR